MSFILDALRKSEARRRQGEPVGLGAPESPIPHRRKSRRAGVVVSALLLAVVVVAAAAGIVVMRPQWLPDQLARLHSQSPSPRPAESDIAPTFSDRTEADPVEPTQPETPTDAAATPPTERPDGRRSASDNDSDEPVAIDRRQPRAAAPERTVSRPAPVRETAPVRSDIAQQELERRIARSERNRQAARPDTPTAPDPDHARTDNVAPAADRRESSRQAPEPLSSGVAEYVHVWELPLSVRRAMPELDLSIHVFSPREEERFVLLNGERYVAGDRLGEDVSLVDIRREGAVIDFRSHRFLLQPR